MARTTVLGKRKAQDNTDEPVVAVETRKRRTLRSVAAATKQKIAFAVENEENEENAVPEVEDATDAEDFSNGILEEISALARDRHEDDTPSRRAEKRGRKVTFATTTIDSHFGVSKVSSTPLSKRFSSLKASSPAAAKTAKVTPLTPNTPSRFRNALAASQTPKHQVRVAGRRPLTPKTPRTLNGTAITVYNTARQLFARGADGTELVGRERERGEIKQFVEAGIEERSGRSLYISGPPGTGKSAFTNQVCEDFKAAEGVRFAYVNCMSVRNTADLYGILLESLCQDGVETEDDMEKTLRVMFFPKSQKDNAMFLITLDEIDHLLTMSLETLYTLFEWALDPKSNLILIGIANALDLTDRFLPRLKAKNLRPQLLPFVPYTVSEIAAVITSRLQSLLPADAADQKFVPFVQAPAIQLCAKKVASQTGDLRKAFDIIRRAIDLVEAEVKAKYAKTPSPSAGRGILTENKNLAAESSSMATPSRASAALSQLTSLTAPRASLAHLAKVTASAFNNGTSTRLKTLNLQQKATLCAIVAHQSRSQTQQSSPFSTPATTNRSPFTTPRKIRVFGKPEPAPTVKSLYETYSGLCKRDGTLAALTSTEFADVVASLEGLGLVVEEKNSTVLATPRKNKGLEVGREEKRVRGCVSEQEVEGCLDGVAGPLLRGLLKGDH